MKYNFADPYINIKSSFIRDMLEVASQKDMISFAGGLPSDKLFPKKQLKKVLANLSENLPEDLLQYSQTMGIEKLRDIIKLQFKLEEDIIITNGGQQAIDLVCSVLLNPNDNILIEDPSYVGAVGLFKSYGVNCDPVSLDKDGIDLNELERKLKKKTYKFLYVIPNFQNPSSLSYTTKRRKALAKLAIKYDLIILEDDPYGRLDFKKNEKKKIFDYAPNHTVYVSSFSKILVPALRVGYIMTNQSIMEKIRIAKQYKDLHTSVFSQYVLYEYLNTFDIFKHIKTLVKEYKKSSDFFYKIFKKELGEYFIIEKPQGGMFLWAKLKDNSDSEDLLKKAIDNKVFFVPGSVFLENKSEKSYIRFNFTHSNKKEIKEGIKRLKSLLK